MKICLDAGHGWENKAAGKFDPGACAGGHKEADITLAWATTANYLLSRAGFDTWMTRTGDHDSCPVSSRDNRATRAGCTHFLSFHCNAGSILASGVETFYRDGADLKWAEIVHAAALAATGLRDRGVRHERETAVKSLAVMAFPGPCALLEIGFLTRKSDRLVIIERDTRIRFAQELIARLR